MRLPIEMGAETSQNNASKVPKKKSCASIKDVTAIDACMATAQQVQTAIKGDRAFN